jgi:hypothetical protein
MMDKKKPVIKIRGEIEVNDGVTLTKIALVVNEVEAKLREIGTGAVKIHVPRGEYGA